MKGLIILTLLLAGCVELPIEPKDRTVKFMFVDNVPEACGIPYAKACAFPDADPCIVVFHKDTWQDYLHHELKHCFEGFWHGG